MPYNEEHITPLEALKVLANLTRSELDALIATALTLRTQIQTLEARQDADVTAATEDSETIDARIDAWANEHASLGTNIRANQIRLSEAIEGLAANLQAQLQELSETRIGGLLEGFKTNERRRQEISSEAKSRIESDSWLQIQIQQLSEAGLKMCITLSEILEALRKLKEE